MVDIRKLYNNLLGNERHSCMKGTKIIPDKITKPIQLLGAWLAGLFSIDSCFLIAAANMDKGSWESMALVIAAIANVPLFLIAVFILQTKFRPELQEDSYYSTYLSQKTNEPISISKTQAHLIEIHQRINRLEECQGTSEVKDNKKNVLQDLFFGVNKHLTDREEIKSMLGNRGILSCSLFGGSEPPKDRIVAVSQYLSKETLKEVIILAGKLGFKFYSIFDNRAEEVREDVLIGAYSRDTYEILTKPA